MNRPEKEIYKEALQEKLHIYSAIMHEAAQHFFLTSTKAQCANQSFNTLFWQTSENSRGKS